MSAFSAAELDYLVGTRLGVDAQMLTLRDLVDAVVVDSLDAGQLTQAAEICERYRDLRLGLADASMVVLAAKWSTLALATLDERHFRAVQSLDERPFELLPGDLPARRR
jgi:hypothetical protein